MFKRMMFNRTELTKKERGENRETLHMGPHRTNYKALAILFIACILPLVSFPGMAAAKSQNKGKTSDYDVSMPNTFPIYKQLRQIKPNGKAIDVTNLTLKRDAAVFTFKKGTFYLLEAVGTPAGEQAGNQKENQKENQEENQEEKQWTGAVFIGEGAFVMTPYLKEEKQHLKILTGSHSIDEKFSKALFRFTDDTFKAISAGNEMHPVSSVSKAGDYFKKCRKLMRKGQKYIRPNIATQLLKYNIDLRLLEDILWPQGSGFFHVIFEGKKYGKMLFSIDPRGGIPGFEPEEVVLAGLKQKNLGVWICGFREKLYRSGAAKTTDTRIVDVEHYDIKASTYNEKLEAFVKVRFKILADGVRVIPFSLFSGLRVANVMDEGTQKQLPFIQGKENADGDQLGIVFPEGLKKGKVYTISVEYTGKKAVANLGGGNYTLVARDTWHPKVRLRDRATYDVTLTTPKALTVVPTGEMIEEKEVGDTRVSHWKCDVPVWVSGFNYGKFKKMAVKDRSSEITIESYANLKMPDSFEGMASMSSISTPMNFRSLDPIRLMDKVRSEAHVGVALNYRMFGPLPFKRIAISQQPFPNFGQAWPMLVYMPIVAYLPSSFLQQMGMSGTFSDFIDLVCAHEVGHQWWGHAVGSNSYRSQWLEEGMAQVSASMFAHVVYKQKRFLKFWEDLRRRALDKNRARKSPAKVGSITLGYRLDTGRTGFVGNSIIYAKSAFVWHMLRMMMWNPRTGDNDFSDMMKDLVKTHYNQSASVADIKACVEKHITPAMNLADDGKMDWYFDQWVYGVLIPHYSLKHRLESASDGKVTLVYSVKQSKVDEAFKMRVPIYADYGGKFNRVGTVVLTGNSESPEQKIILAKKPDRVLLCAFEDILCTQGK